MDKYSSGSAMIRRSLELASGESWLDTEPNREIDIVQLAQPATIWAKQVDAVEKPFAAVYDSAEYGNRALQMLNLAEFSLLYSIGDVAGKRVLDVGCGTGRITLWAAAQGATVTALDQTAAYVALTAKKAERLPVRCQAPHCTVSPLEAILDSAERYDAVTAMFAVLNHCEDWAAATAGLAKLLSAGGSFVTSMYGSPDAVLFREIKNGLGYEPAILVRRTAGGLLLGDSAADILPARFPYPEQVTQILETSGLMIKERRPLLAVTAFYPQVTSAENITKYLQTVKRLFGQEVVCELSATDDPDRLLVCSLMADYKIAPDMIDQAAYFGIVATKEVV